MKFHSCLWLPALAGLALAQALLPRPAAAEENAWTGNANAFLGAKALDENDWQPANQQGEVGFELDFSRRNWPLSLAIDYLTAAGKGSVYSSLGTFNMESQTSELNVGLRKVWDSYPHARPFIEGGVSFARASARITGPGVSAEDSGGGTGTWLGGGIYWALSDSFNLGLELKSSAAKVNLFGVDTTAGGGHLGLLLGYHWGGAPKRREGDGPAAPAPGLRGEPPYYSRENAELEIERQKLDLEKQKLELEKEKFELEKKRQNQ